MKRQHLTRRQKDYITKVESALAKKEIRNCGRWCEVTLNKTGETVKIVRTGYGAMERPEGDSHEVLLNGELVKEFNNLTEVAMWIICRNNH